MRLALIALLIGAACLATGASRADFERWAVVPGDSAITMRVGTPVGARTGRFMRWTGDIRFDPDAPETAQVAIEVEDRGTGFAEGEEARIFEPFYRRSEQGSLGLGLSLVKRIAEAHGGRAYAENRVGGGARVAIALPFAVAS